MNESASSTDDADMPPDIPDFDLIRRIGEGGFGEVWLATNRATGHLRAVKVIALQNADMTDPAGREITSLTELEAHVRSQHPNLVAIYHVAQTADCLFYVMDPGDDASGNPASDEADYRPATLESLLAAGPLQPDVCWRYAEQLLAGLACLHEAGMVHRDVKPSNCLFIGGELKLADFGLVTKTDREISRLGTWKYMPPDGCMDMRADVYAAGLVIYEMITGRPVLRFPRLSQKAREVAQDPVLSVLNRIALRAGQPDPERRFADARAMLAELQASDPKLTAQRARRRRRMLASIGGTAALVLLAVLAWLAWLATRPPRVRVNFVTHPFEATIYLDNELLRDSDGIPYRTPCTVPDVPARIHRVVFRHDAQEPPLDVGRVDFANRRQVVGHWGPGS